MRKIERRKSKSLQIAERRFETLFNAIPEPVLVINEDRKIVFANMSYLKMLRMNSAPEIRKNFDKKHSKQQQKNIPRLDDLLGKRIYDYVPRDQHNIIAQAIDRIFETIRPGYYEIRQTGPNGPDSACYSTRLGPILDDEGRVIGIIMISTDITEQ